MSLLLNSLVFYINLVVDINSVETANDVHIISLPFVASSARALTLVNRSDRVWFPWVSHACCRFLASTSNSCLLSVFHRSLNFTQSSRLIDFIEAVNRPAAGRRQYLLPLEILLALDCFIASCVYLPSARGYATWTIWAVAMVIITRSEQHVFLGIVRVAVKSLLPSVPSNIPTARMEVLMADMSVLIVALAVTVYVLEVVHCLACTETRQSAHTTTLWPVSLIIFGMTLMLVLADWWRI